MKSISESYDPLRVTAGPGALAAALHRFRLGDRPLVLRDAAVDPVALTLPPGAVEIEVDARSTDVMLVPRAIESGQRATSVVAVGGGTVLDAAKIVRLLLIHPGLATPLQRLVPRSGFVRLPDVASRPATELALLAVPTTFGTGSEASRVACLPTASGRRLIFGERLLPDHAVLDPVLTATLSRSMQMEGLWEIILRILGPAIGSGGDLAADSDAEAIVSRSARLAEQLRIGFLAPEERLLAAQLSAASHRSWALIGRHSYAAKHWYLANELAWVTGTRKMPATVTILPALWGRIADGDHRWGSAERLALAWSWLRDVIAGLPADPREGLPLLLGRWGLRPIARPTESELHETVERIHSSWGGSLPALGRIEPDAVAEILAASFPRGTSLPTTVREEVTHT